MRLAAAWLILALTWAAAGPAAQAEPGLGGSLVLGSDYPYRGISRSQGRPSAALDIETTADGPYAGVSAAAVAYDRGRSGRDGAELEFYGGWRGYARGYELDVGAQYDSVSRQPGGGNEDSFEAYARIGRSVGPVRVSAGVHVSPAAPDGAGTSAYVEARAAYAFAPGWRVSAEVGRVEVSRPSRLRISYDAFEVRLSRQVARNLALELVGTANDQSGFEPAYRPRIALRARVRF